MRKVLGFILIAFALVGGTAAFSARPASSDPSVAIRMCLYICFLPLLSMGRLMPPNGSRFASAECPLTIQRVAESSTQEAAA